MNDLKRIYIEPEDKDLEDRRAKKTLRGLAYALGEETRCEKKS